MNKVDFNVKAFLEDCGLSGAEVLILKSLLHAQLNLKQLVRKTKRKPEDLKKSLAFLLNKKIISSTNTGDKSVYNFINTYEPQKNLVMSQQKILAEEMTKHIRDARLDYEYSGDTLFVRGGFVFLQNFNELPAIILYQIQNLLDENKVQLTVLNSNKNILILPQFFIGNKKINLAEKVGEIINFVALQKKKLEMKNSTQIVRNYKKKIDFIEINNRALDFVNFVKSNLKNIEDILIIYESYEVVKDEINRSIDVLSHLDENKEFFQREIGSVATFMPRNQPFYALSCFALVPSLMANEVHVRAPMAMNHFFFNFIKELKIDKYFPNVFISTKTREEFLKERIDIKKDPETGQEMPVTDVVIFTGTMENADKMRDLFSKDVFFIANGAGHNPIVVTDTADVKRAVIGAMEVQLYNQGQDCANPNAILVHKKVLNIFLEQLKKELKKVKFGPYSDRENKIGPISERRDLKKIQELLVDNAEWLSPFAEGIIHTKSSIIEPTIIIKPLKLGGNYIEQFAPIFFIQEYSDDDELSIYFDDPRYMPNAMYVTVFGKSKYVDNLINKIWPGGKMLHDEDSIIRNTDLHAPGVERGVKPYGGYGRGASCISLNGVITAKPTLPPRDIYENLVFPILRDEEED